MLMCVGSVLLRRQPKNNKKSQGAVFASPNSNKPLSIKLRIYRNVRRNYWFLFKNGCWAQGRVQIKEPPSLGKETGANRPVPILITHLFIIHKLKLDWMSIWGSMRAPKLLRTIYCKTNPMFQLERKAKNRFDLWHIYTYGLEKNKNIKNENI